MFDSTGVLPPRPVGVDEVSGCDGERFSGVEAESRFGGSGLDFVVDFYEATDQTGHLVRGDAFVTPTSTFVTIRSIPRPRSLTDGADKKGGEVRSAPFSVVACRYACRRLASCRSAPLRLAPQSSRTGRSLAPAQRPTWPRVDDSCSLLACI